MDDISINDRWMMYWCEHADAIESWINRFAPATTALAYRYTTRLPKLNRFILAPMLQQAWEQAPDDSMIHVEGFNELCNLLDGGFE